MMGKIILDDDIELFSQVDYVTQIKNKEQSKIQTKIKSRWIQLT